MTGLPRVPIPLCLFVFLLLPLAGCGGGDDETESRTVADCSADLPSLSPDPLENLAGYFEGEFYEGPLFETSLQMGDGGENSVAPATLVNLMNRHNVVRAMAMFGLDADDDSDMEAGGDEGFGFIEEVVNAAPCRFIPFFVKGTGEDDSLEAENIQGVLDRAEEIFGTQIVRGIGELEIYKESWGLLDLDDPSLTAVFDIASSGGLDIFSHWAGGPDRVGPEVGLPQRTTSIRDSMERAFQQYPGVNFVFHLFPTDIETAVFDLMETTTNFYFSVDLSHFMQRVPWQCGLLECFASSDDPVAEFAAEFDANVDAMLDQALERYRPLIEAHPDQFLWGSENVELYDFETEVYDRALLFTRAFIAQLEVSVQEKFAYQNAETLFGAGIGQIQE